MIATTTSTTCAECGAAWPDAPARPSLVGGCGECRREYKRRYQVHVNYPRLRERCKASSKAYYDENKERINEQRLVSFLTELGITLEEYREVLDKQGGVCAICREPETGRFGRLAVDHDHTTGEFRGLLCSRCNKALGLLRDNQDALRRALQYLER